jgi:hypothetical protein
MIERFYLVRDNLSPPRLFEVQIKNLAMRWNHWSRTGCFPIPPIKFYARKIGNMSTDSSTKTVKITTGAAESLSPSNYEEAAGPEQKGGKTRKSSKGHSSGRRVNVQKEGGAMSPGTLDQLVSSRAPGIIDISQAVGASSKMTEEGAPVGKVAPTATGGSTEPKVHLAKTQKKSKVVLAPSVKKTRVDTKKQVTKMLKMNIGRLTRRMKKASGIHKSAKEMTIEDIKKTLIQMELVNKNTKAPEDVLRQIYSDVETMKKRAL